MCMICVEITKGKMTVKEGRTALRELVATPPKQEDRAKQRHFEELVDLSDDELLEKAKETK